MVSTGFGPDGFPRGRTEIINLDQDGVTCKDLEEYPLQVYGAVGSNMGSLPVICGGFEGRLGNDMNNQEKYVKQCHRLESGKWTPFANLAQGYVLY